MNHTIVVPNLSGSTRLDKFLVQELGSDWSRSALQRAIEHGQVKVNGKRVPVHHFLKAGETITIEAAQPPTQAAMPQPNAEVTFVTAHETPDFVVIDKPAGLVVHPAPGVHEPTLVDGLLARYPEIAHVGDDPTRPGIVHRLDREVSGLMVVARTQAMFESLKSQFAARTIHKHYVALVVGRVASPEGTIDFPLARSKRSHGKIAARPRASTDTREAITHYQTRQTFQQVTLLDISIETGRTHQIRAHLAALGYPIVGDTHYRPPSLKFKATPGRLFLHAAELEFTDLANQRQRFVSPLPQDLQAFLTHLA